MQFALNQSCFPNETVDDNVELVADAGFDGFEPNLTEDGPLCNDDGVAHVADLADEHDLSVPSISTTLHWDYPLSSDDATLREEGIDRAERMLEAADVLGADTILLVPGVLEATPDYDVAYETALQSVRTLAKSAPTDVTVSVENVGNGMLMTPIEFAAFVDDAAEAGDVGAYFDVGNALYYDQRPDHWLRILSDRLTKVHVKGYGHDVGITYPLQGDVDWPAVTDALEDIGYDGWITAEVPPYSHRPDLTPRHVLESIRAGLGVHNPFDST